MTNGGDNAVTTRNTERARADKPGVHNGEEKCKNYILISDGASLGPCDTAINNNGDTLTRHNDIAARPNNRVQTYSRTRHRADASPFR